MFFALVPCMRQWEELREKKHTFRLLAARCHYFLSYIYKYFYQNTLYEYGGFKFIDARTGKETFEFHNQSNHC
jgi:hypothetical protein